MAKKTKAKPKEPMFISLSLPVEGNFPRKGTILVRHESLAVLHSFEYRSMRDILDAINAAVDHQLVIEADPPVIPALTATAATTAAAATVTPAPTDTAPDTAADEAGEGGDPTNEDGAPTDEEGESGADDFSAQDDEQPDMLFQEEAEESMPAGDPADNFATTSVTVSQAALF